MSMPMHKLVQTELAIAKKLIEKFFGKWSL